MQSNHSTTLLIYISYGISSLLRLQKSKLDLESEWSMWTQLSLPSFRPIDRVCLSSYYRSLSRATILQFLLLQWNDQINMITMNCIYIWNLINYIRTIPKEFKISKIIFKIPTKKEMSEGKHDQHFWNHQFSAHLFWTCFAHQISFPMQAILPLLMSS